MAKGKFIVVDGVTGSGKSTILRAIKAWSASCQHKTFDLEEWSQTHHDPPTFDDVKDADVLYTFEPTKTWIGSAIRKELSRTDKPYSAMELAQAFSLDRLLMYKRLILPALEAGKTIVQDRSVTSSIFIQLSQEPRTLTIEELLALPGNALALEHAPDILVLTHVKPETAAQRLQARANESKGVFEDPELLRRMAGVISSEWFSKLFADRGTAVHHFDADIPKDEMEQRAQALINHIFTTC